MYNIKTVFYSRKDILKTNSSNDANMAVASAVRHLQINRYGATHCEVFDSETGELHAQIKRSINGTLTIMYQRDPSKYERKLSLYTFKEFE